jgi:hypothetical protein
VLLTPISRLGKGASASDYSLSVYDSEDGLSFQLRDIIERNSAKMYIYCLEKNDEQYFFDIRDLWSAAGVNEIKDWPLKVIHATAQGRRLELVADNVIPYCEYF